MTHPRTQPANTAPRRIPIADAPNYTVSDTGEVRNEKTGRTLSPFNRGYSGHLAVDLPCGRRSVHQLVAEAFHGPRPAGLDTRHLDNDPTNNTPANLAYGTRSQNVLDLRQIRTACPHGHEYTPANSYINPSGARSCRECKKRYR